MVDALAGADLRVLLMVLHHLTGEARWLEPPLVPKRDVNLIADESAGLAPEAAQAIRAAALEVLSQPTLHAAIADPGDALMVRMMSACLGEKVAPEYAPMMREEMGLCTRQVQWEGPAAARAAVRRPVLIVGAGASGITLGANLACLGVPFVVLEAADQVGGTWYRNTYPGCGVDTPNHAYSFSFTRPHRWTRYFAGQAEIRDYLIASAAENEVTRQVRFRTRMTAARWDEAASTWRVQVEGPDGAGELEAGVLVSAIGQLSDPSLPALAGLDDFRGPSFHSSRWPADLDLAGKRLAVIGTGASSMQIVPAVADEVAALTVYQRSPQWARPIPRYKDPIGAGAQWLMAHVPFYAAWFRFTMLWRYGDGLLPTLRKDPAWPHPERSLNRVNDRHREQMTAHIVASLGDRADLLPKCMPTYPPYGKRILLDSGWYEALLRPKVELVSDDIARIRPDGIETVDGRVRTADVIVLATGFKVAQLAARLGIRGRGGRLLSEAWKDDNPTAYLGITVPGFPNFFCMQGPNTGLGHGGSAIFQAECQARYIAGSIVAMAQQRIASMEVRQEVHDDYVRRVDAEHEAMIWTHPGMSTYYRNKAGRVVSVMPWRLVDYWSMTHEPHLDDYELAHAAGTDSGVTP
ncbi:MAG: flavin-containing monooxygenase [Burkholderiales bacterium]